MAKKGGGQPTYKHNYKWLFHELRQALHRAEADLEFNRAYEFHNQKGPKLQWPQRLLNEIAPFYAIEIGYPIDGARLKTKILNTRVQTFRVLARRSEFSADFEFVDEFDPRRLTQAAPAKSLRTFQPAPAKPQAPRELQVLPEPRAPQVAAPLSVGALVASIGLDALAQVEILSEIATAHDLASLDADMRMAVLLRTNM